MKWERAIEGELTIDHRDSPGLRPEEMPRGILAPGIAVGKGQKYESATFTCPHCHVVVIVNPLRNRDHDRCWYCGQKRICGRALCLLMANGTVAHKPVQQVMEEFVNQLEKGDL